MEQHRWVFLAGGEVRLASGHRVRRILTGETAEAVSSAASLVRQSKQKTSWKPINQPTTH